MENLQVQKYTTEIKVYIAATILMVVFIVGLVWWNAAKDAEREAQLKALYTAYEDLSRHIERNIDINKFAVCEKMEGQANEAPAAEDPAMKAALEEKLATRQTEMQNFKTHIESQFAFLNENRPMRADPDLLTDATLFRLNKTYNEFMKNLERLSEKCGELTAEQVDMRTRRYNKLLARFTESLKDLEGSNN
ncbi:MAG: hypothetical protein C4523_09230 [Myxococcales bacterium]|nr:MAG: hypothetical protein C4523_09230 [Myxococcales bacterium]